MTTNECGSLWPGQECLHGWCVSVSIENETWARCECAPGWSTWGNEFAVGGVEWCARNDSVLKGLYAFWTTGLVICIYLIAAIIKGNTAGGKYKKRMAVTAANICKLFQLVIVCGWVGSACFNPDTYFNVNRTVGALMCISQIFFSLYARILASIIVSVFVVVSLSLFSTYIYTDSCLSVEIKVFPLKLASSGYLFYVASTVCIPCDSKLVPS